jgi:hypothetical protein
MFSKILTFICRWQLVSLVTLLSQGLIFGNEDIIPPFIVLLIGVLNGVSIIGLVVFNGTLIVLRKFKVRKPSSFSFDGDAFAALDSSIREELFQIYSKEHMEQDGHLILGHKKMNSLTAEQRYEVLSAMSKVPET